MTDPAIAAILRRSALPVLSRLLFLALALRSASGAEMSNVRFDLPADKAETSLKRLSQQSGVEVLYPTDVVAGVRTNAVQGTMTARQALETMLAGTALVAIEGKSTASLTVKRKEPAANSEKNAPKMAQPSGSDSSRESLKKNETEKPQPPMKKNKLLTNLSAIIALFAGSPSGAQTAGTGAITGRVRNVATGQYLNNAQISVKGTNFVAFSDAFGTYRLPDVPSGPITINVFFTGLDPQEVAVEVPRGGSLEKNIDLTSAARYGAASVEVKLDAFIVNAEKETDAQALAINEQRFAANIKSVVSTDSFGAVVGNNMGEFLKALPGIVAEYNAGNVTEVSVRGIGGGMTSVTSDGAPVASSGSQIPTRAFAVLQMALNDVSRIEVTKVPTPANPADSLGGAVNVISKNTFERSGAEFRYSVVLQGDAANVTLKKQPDFRSDSKMHRVLPSFDFEYTLPINKTFGVMFTGMQSTKFNQQNVTILTYSAAGAGTGASISSPFLNSYFLADSQRFQEQKVLSIKADWKPTPNSVLSIGGRVGYLETSIGTMNVTHAAGTTGTPTIATGTSMTYGPNYTNGATGRGAVTLGTETQVFNQDSRAVDLGYRYDNGRWRIEARASESNSDYLKPDSRFYSMGFGMRVPVRVNLANVTSNSARALQTFDNNNQEVDIGHINNYNLTATRDYNVDSKTRFQYGNLTIRRRLDAFSFPMSIQAGGDQKINTIDSGREERNWTYNGLDGDPTTFDSAEKFLSRVYVRSDFQFGFNKIVPLPSNSRAWQEWQMNPILFSQTTAQQVSSTNFHLQNSEKNRESVSSLYLQSEMGLLDNRLRVLTGVRYEKTVGKGEGLLTEPDAVFVRNANGSFARDSGGNRIRRPEAGLPNSMAQLLLTTKERGAKVSRTYDGYFPSLHLNYQMKENILIRIAYARTYGRPNFSDIIPRTVITDRNLTPEQIGQGIGGGTLSVRNTALNPWRANNYDLSLEYYTQQQGLFSAGFFIKDISDFFGAAVRPATEADLAALNLESRYVGWDLATKFNAGDAKITGGEFNFNHPLGRLHPWGRNFRVFGNATKLRLEGNPGASFTSFVPLSANIGVSFAYKRLSIIPRWNYRGLDKRTAVTAFGPDAFAYREPRTQLDLSVSYQLNNRLTLVASVTNVWNEPGIVQTQYGSQTPDYARNSIYGQYGTQFNAGIKGKF